MLGRTSSRPSATRLVDHLTIPASLKTEDPLGKHSAGRQAAQRQNVPAQAASAVHGRHHDLDTKAGHRPAIARKTRQLWFAASLVCILIASGSRAESIRVPGTQLAMQFQRFELDRGSPSALCRAAVRAAEARYRLPPGLLLAIAKVETGRFDATTHQNEPWPWTVQAENRGLYFESKAAAVQWVKDAVARGTRSVDTGCLQVNLLFHPNAFANVEQAFDPASNADYAGRFLLQLHAMTGDWGRASGFYHSQELSRASAYQQRVKQVAGVSILATQSTILSKLHDAWRATIETKTAISGQIAR